MAKSDILSDGIFMPTAVGSNVYVWGPKGSRPKGDRACVITAHGTDIDALINSPSDLPKVPLYFYCPHGRALEDTTAQGVMRGTMRYYEKYESGHAKQDYVLTKAQGSHSEKSKENYADLQQGWHPHAARAAAEAEFAFALQEEDRKRFGAHKAVYEKQPDLYEKNVQGARKAMNEKLQQAGGDIVMDVVTIRDRKYPHLQRTMTLFGVIKLLESKGFRYSAVHCFFCRGPGEKHNPKDNLHSV